MTDNEIEIYCPICKNFYKKVLIDDLINGIRIDCSKCNSSFYIEDYAHIHMCNF